MPVSAPLGTDTANDGSPGGEAEADSTTFVGMLRLPGKVALNNGTVVVFDPHGEYGKALSKGELNFNANDGTELDSRDELALPKIRATFERLQAAGAGIHVYTPQNESFTRVRHQTAVSRQFGQPTPTKSMT